MKLRIVHNAGLNPDLLILHRSPVRSMLVGVVVLAIGVSAILGGASLLGSQPPPFMPYVVFMFLFGGGLALLGCALIGRRIGFDVDRRSKTVTAWTRYIGLRQTRTYSLNEFETVLVTKYWLFNRLGRTEEEFYFRLALRPADAAAANLEFDEGLREADATRLAREIAEFISFPVEQVKGRVEGVVSGR